MEEENQTAPATSANSAERLLLKGLFDYIGEQLKEIDPKAYRLSGSTGFRKGRADFANLPGVEFDIQTEGDHIWLRVSRLEATSPPAVPASHKNLIKFSADPDGAAPSLIEESLRFQIGQAAEGKPEAEWPAIEAGIRNSADKALVEYSVRWRAWAGGEKSRRKSIALYSDLFALKHQIEAEETSNPTELVWGVGITTWRLSHNSETFAFEYPLLTQATEIALDEQTMALEIRPRTTGTRVEMAAFAVCGILSAPEVERAIREHLTRHNDRPVSPFDAGSYSDVLKLVAANLDSKGSYREIQATDETVPPAGEHLVVTDAWTLFARPRNNHFLLEDLKRLKDNLDAVTDIPEGPLALVTPPSDEPVAFERINFRGLSSRGDTASGKKPEELFFPLPYNDEQVTIVQRLEQSAGVTVQGPPGTGKTHTIANIICHYLASGKRVLVTSRGEPALEVLQSKIPEDVRPLTVALLTGDREGLRQFQASIETIQHQVSQLNEQQTQRQIESLKQQIDNTHSQLAKIDDRIDEIALAQLSNIEVDGAPMRADKMAELVISGRTQYAWFDDALSLAPEHTPPLKDSEAAHLRELRRSLGNDIVYAYASLPSADALPDSTAIAQLHDILARIRELDAEQEAGTLLPLKARTPEVLAAAQNLQAEVEKAKALIEDILTHEADWPFELRVKCRTAFFKAEREALESLFVDMDDLITARAEFLKRPVEFPEAGLTHPKTREAVLKAAQTGKPFGLFSFGQDEAKTHLSAVMISGVAPASAEDWAHVGRYMALHGKVLSFQVRWNGFADTLALPHLNGGVTALRHIEFVTLAARKAHTLATTFDVALPRLADAVFDQPPRDKLLGKLEDLQTVHTQLDHHLTRAKLSQAAAQLAALQEKLADKTGPIAERLRHFVDQDLGNPGLEASRAAGKFAELTVELRRIANRSQELADMRDYIKRVEKAGAVKLAERLKSQPVHTSGEDLVLPVTWRQAWTWARLKAHLESIEAREELLRLAAERRDLEDALSRHYQDIVAKAAWLSTKVKASPRVMQALSGYATAVRRIGQGTGPNAVRYKRDARQSMLDAADAVPCWIMSHTKISESMPADIGKFDLVIVDEASQSNLLALPAIVRAKKILVVGDDKQVSPDGGFIDSRHISELRARFLSDQPYGVEMTPEKSLYDLAARVFAGEQVMLREHFRCVPPIIAYSNRTFYEGKIAPLRIPKASERIDPPLVDIYVPGGQRDRRQCNHMEARAIADEIAAILANDQFANRTIGVISLLGMEQAKHIDALVRQRCDAAELYRRKFECGDARTFQGSERDIIFVSMVVDPDGCKAVAGNMFEQRFNVAASRARDRMYLVRSVAGNHLSGKDLRLTLLNHFDKPMLTEAAEESENLIDLCESGFEEQVFTELIDRGYRVIPQVKSGAYRIDMVVEGANDARLAIELDGDAFHGPERWQADMNRQRVLERAGWVFWRCFASTWQLNKEEVLAELLARLTSMGIEPLGAIERVPSLVEKRVWEPAEPEEDLHETASLFDEALITD